MQVVVGQVGRPHGVRGEVTIESRTDQPAERFAPGSVLGISRPPPSVARSRRGVAHDAPPSAASRSSAGFMGLDTVAVTNVRWHGARLLVSFDGIDDRTAAEGIRGVLLVADVAEAEQTDDPDEFHDHQLVGLAVRRVDQTLVGEVHEVVHLPMQDLLVVGMSHGREVLVPFVRAIVPEVCVARGSITVDPPAGLFDDDEGGTAASDDSGGGEPEGR